MTILSVKNQLLTHFLSHDTFEFSRHALEIEFDKEVVGYREQLICAALADLEAQGLVKKMTSDNLEKQMWVLVQPIAAAHQQVVVGALISNLIADTINQYNEIEGIEVLCDKSKIDEGDILRLIHIIENYEEFMERIKSGKVEVEEGRGEDEEEDDE